MNGNVSVIAVYLLAYFIRLFVYFLNKPLGNTVWNSVWLPVTYVFVFLQHEKRNNKCNNTHTVKNVVLHLITCR